MSKHTALNRDVFQSSDWWSVWLGLIIVLTILPASLGYDVAGWMAQVKNWEWSDFWQAPAWDKLFIAPVATESGKGLGGITAWLVSYLVFMTLFGLVAWRQKKNLKQFLLGFSCLYLLTWACWIVSHEAHFRAVLSSQSYSQPTVYGSNVFCTKRLEVCDQQIAAALKAANVKLRPGQQPSRSAATAAVEQSPNMVRLSWSLHLGNGFAFLLAFCLGLILSRYAPKLKVFMRETLKPDLYIKIAIVCFGATLGSQGLSMVGQNSQLLLTTAVAALVCFFLLWPAIYTLCRRVFDTSRINAALLSSGIAGGGLMPVLLSGVALKSRALIPIALSCLIVLFATIELVSLPKFYAALSRGQPVVTGAALGLTMKSDQLDSSAAALLDAKMVQQHYRATGVAWKQGVIASAANMTRYWLVVIVTLWSLLLAWLWVRFADEKGETENSQSDAFWHGLPKCLFAMLLVWLFYLCVTLWGPSLHLSAMTHASIVGETGLTLLLLMAFFSAGMLTEPGCLTGFGKYIWLYAVGILVIVPPLAYLLAYIFHNGLFPT